jgi:hypothetical protein
MFSFCTDPGERGVQVYRIFILPQYPLACGDGRAVDLTLPKRGLPKQRKLRVTTAATSMQRRLQNGLLAPVLQ